MPKITPSVTVVAKAAPAAANLGISTKFRTKFNPAPITIGNVYSLFFFIGTRYQDPKITPSDLNIIIGAIIMAIVWLGLNFAPKNHKTNSLDMMKNPKVIGNTRKIVKVTPFRSTCNSLSNRFSAIREDVRGSMTVPDILIKDEIV